MYSLSYISVNMKVKVPHSILRLGSECRETAYDEMIRCVLCIYRDDDDEEGIMTPGELIHQSTGIHQIFI